MPNVRKIVNKSGISWLAEYYAPGGRRVQRRFPRRALAEAFLAKAVTAIHEGRYAEIAVPPRRTTIAELAEDYVALCGRQRSFASWKKGIVEVIVAELGNRRLLEITYRDLELFREERRAVPTWKGTPRSPARVNREMAVLRHMLNKAVEWGLLKTSPFAAGRPLRLREAGHRQRFLTAAEEARLLAECPGHLRPIVELALLTGLRAGELLPLKWEQIRGGFIYITAPMAKSGKPRAVPLCRRAEKVLAGLRARHQLSSPHVFGRRYGSVKTAFRAALRRAGIEGFRFHDLRHTFASNLVRRGVSLRAVQEILGHAGVGMTTRYAHLAPGDLTEAVRALDGEQHEEEVGGSPGHPDAVRRLSAHRRGRRDLRRPEE